MPFRARSFNIVTEAQIQHEIAGHAPVVLNKSTRLVTLGAGVGGNVVAAGAVDVADHQSRHRVSAYATAPRGRPRRVHRKQAVWYACLYEVNAMAPDLTADLNFMPSR